MNFFALINQKLPLKPIKDVSNIISRCAHYILLATYLVWLFNPCKGSLGFFYIGLFSNSCYPLMSHVTCHLSHVRCHISDVTRHMSPVANAIVICWQAGNFISPVKSFNLMLKEDAKGCEMRGILNFKMFCKFLHPLYISFHIN